MDQNSLNSERKISNLQLSLHIFLTFILLFTFLIGVKSLGTSIKLLGGDFAKEIFNLTINPFVSIFVGILTTSLVQSSSVTTSLVVGLVSSGTLGIENAIPIIMGANIGTSVTNTIVSMANLKNNDEFKNSFAAATVHDFFNFLSVLVFLPLELTTGFLAKISTFSAKYVSGEFANLQFNGPLIAAIKPFVSFLKTAVQGLFDGKMAGAVLLLLSFLILIFSLTLIAKNMKNVVVTKIGRKVNRFLQHPVMAIGFGISVTIAVQSSSITTSLLIPMASSGILTLPVIYPITIGANIGTTATALMAAMAGNFHGLVIALVHLFFNLGGLLLWYPFKPLRNIPIKLAQKFSEIAVKNKFMAIGYVLSVFIFLPLGLIWATS